MKVQVQRFRGLKVQGFRGLEVQGFRVQGLRGSGVQGSEVWDSEFTILHRVDLCEDIVSKKANRRISNVLYKTSLERIRFFKILDRIYRIDGIFSPAARGQL